MKIQKDDKQSLEQIETSKLSGLQFTLPKEEALLQALKEQKEQKKAALIVCERWLKEHAQNKALFEKFPEMEKLEQLRAELVLVSKKQSANSKLEKKATDALTKKKLDIKVGKTKISQLKGQIVENEKIIKQISGGNSLEQLQSVHVEQQERVVNFRELFDLASVNAKLGKKSLFTVLFAFKSAAKEENQLNEELERLQLKIGKERNLVKTLDAAVINETLLKKMELDRLKLADGKACPLCGALEHPFTKYKPALSNSRKILKETQKKLKKLVADETSLNKQILSAQRQATNDEQKEDKLQNVISQWNILANRLNILSEDMDIGKLSVMKGLLKTEKKELDEIAKLLKQMTQLRKSVEQAKDAISANTVSLTRMTKEVEELIGKRNSRPKEATEIEKNYNQLIAQEKILAEKVKKQLELLGEKMPKKGKEANFLKSLARRKKEMQTQIIRQQSLAKEMAQLDKQIVDGSGKINILNQSITNHSDHLSS